jgi:hypothetical protein
MTTDVTIAYLETAVRLAGVNRFYTRRVLQRCARREITPKVAAELLIAAAQKGEATIEVVSVRRWIPDPLS